MFRNAEMTNRKFALITLVAFLVLAMLACAEKQFVNPHVYAAISGSANQFYDQTTDKLLADDVWVFRPDGTYSAIVNVDGQRLMLSGRYGGDNAAEDFFIAIDTDGDGEYDDSLYASDDFSYIEWRRSDGTLKYVLAP